MSQSGQVGGMESFKLCRGQKIKKVWKVKNVSALGEGLEEEQLKYKDDNDGEDYFNLDYICVPPSPAGNNGNAEDSENEGDASISSSTGSGTGSGSEGGSSSSGSSSDDDDNDGGHNENSSFLIEVDAGADKTKKPARSRVRVFLQKHSAPEKGNETSVKRWLSLNVEQLRNDDNLIVQYHFEVEAALEGQEDQMTDEKKSFEFQSKLAFTYDEEAPVGTLKKKIVQLQSYKNYRKVISQGYARKSSGGRQPVAVNRSKKLPVGNLTLTISVTPIFVAVPFPSNFDDKELLCRALDEKLYAAKNCADINLETTEKKIFGSHKFIVSARSPVLSDLIEKAVKETGRKVKIKVDINTDAMRVVSHWMYTAELISIVDHCLEDVVEAAVKYQLKDLMPALEKRMMAICTPDNMIRLFRIVKRRKNEMPNGFAHLSKFIQKDLNLELECCGGGPKCKKCKTG